jgi:hypothetical protein
LTARGSDKAEQRTGYESDREIAAKAVRKTCSGKMDNVA